MLRISLVFLVTVLTATLSQATTYYVCGSATSCNSGNGSPSDWSTGSSGNTGLSKALPKATIAQGIAAMTGSDTLIIGNGTYTNDPIRDMPSGASGAYTIIKSENVGGVTVSTTSTEPIAIGGSDHHIQVEGVKAVSSGMAIYVAGDYIKILRVAAVSTSYNSAGVVAGTTTGASYVLFEECWAWGGGRYKFIAYESDNIVFRRCVSRHDYNTDGGGEGTTQQANFVHYDSTNTYFQNCIAIDSGVAGSGQSLYGAFWGENNANTDKSGKITGSIALNVITNQVAITESVSGTRSITDNVLWHTGGGWGGIAMSTTHTPHITINQNTIGDIMDTGIVVYGEYGPGSGNKGNWDGVTTNTIITGAYSYAIADYMVSDYNALYDNGDNYGGAEHTPTAGTHDITNVNPLTNCLKYLPRIESTNCSLYTAGSGGGRIGAEILYKHGTSGTLYGETGYDTLTSDPLWPFPNEALIKADFASYSGPGPAGARGFAATGNGLYGGPITLTSYIWEYLGNEMDPADIYEEAEEDTTDPTITVFDMPATATSTTVGVTSFTATDDTGVTGYCITTTNDSSGCSWTGTAPTTATGAEGANTFYAWAKDAADNVSTASTDTTTITLPECTYYVRSDGNNGNTGTANTSGGAWLTLQYASDEVAAGDTVCVADGTYAGFYVETSGTSGSPITFKTLGTGANITSANANTSDNVNIEGDPAPGYITIDGFNVYNSARDGIRAVGGTGIIIKNNTVHDCARNGILSGWTPSIQVLNNNTYENGSATGQHNIYVSNYSSDNCIIRGNIAHSSGGENGIQLNGDWESGGDGFIDNALIEDNIVYNNLAKGFSIISVRYSTIRNNIVYDNGASAGGIHVASEGEGHYSIDNTIVNNTIDEPSIATVRINEYNTGNVVFNNVSIGSTGIVFEGTGNYQSNNVTTTTGFTNRTTHDYSLATGSDKIDAGLATYQSKSAATDDYLGLSRPQGGVYDVGAYEFEDEEDPPAATAALIGVKMSGAVYH